MTKIMQNLVVLMEPSEKAYETPLKGGNMILNRFCIDEDAAFELTGVNYSRKERLRYNAVLDRIDIIADDDREKGMKYSFLRFYLILRNLTLKN